MNSSTLLLVVFGLTTAALAFGVPLMLLRGRVRRPLTFALAGIAFYAISVVSIRTLMLREVPSIADIKADYANGDLTEPQFNEMATAADEAATRAGRAGMGIGLMGAIAIAWVARMFAGRDVAESRQIPELRTHVVGRECAVCTNVISMETDGRECATCGSVTHRRCKAAHRRAAHPAEKVAKRAHRGAESSILAEARVG